jgi:DNA polymerase-4
VGGRPEERGVVASCSYAARQYGVRSAMPMGRALRLCPGLIIVPGRHGAYGEMSRKVMARLHALTPLVEQLSIDEAYLDVTETAGRTPGGAEALARHLQTMIRDELGLPCSLGVATNKLVAKIANNVGKAAVRGPSPPNAITAVAPGAEAAFLAPLSCNELWGVGPRTADRLAALGIHTIGQLTTWPEARLINEFGKHGAELYRKARGRDDSPIVTQRERKSVSQETTFVRDVADGELLRRTLFGQAREVALALRRKRIFAATVKLKLRWSNFETITRQTRLESPSDDQRVIFRAVVLLFEKAWDGKPVRLIGAGVSGLVAGLQQESLFDVPNEADEARRARLRETLEKLRTRYGDDAVLRAGDLERNEDEADH